jgi:hypothetical protein
MYTVIRAPFGVVLGIDYLMKLLIILSDELEIAWKEAVVVRVTGLQAEIRNLNLQKTQQMYHYTATFSRAV